MIKQYIVLRRDAPTLTGEPVSAAKLAVMTAHASMGFLMDRMENGKIFLLPDEIEWFDGIQTKVLLSAKNLHAMNRIVDDARAAGMVEGNDIHLVHDVCNTELVPDEGSDTCFVAIGFRPMEEEYVRPIVKRLQVYR